MNVIDSESPRIEQPKCLKLQLYEYQKAIVYAMTKLENDRQLYPEYPKTSAGIMSDPVGSGKTIVCVSLILNNPNPKICPQICKINNQILIRKFNTILRPTLIVVGINVLKQWVKTVRENTDLTLLVVKNVFELRNLLDGIIYDHDYINQFDVIILKNGGTTAKIDIDFTKFSCETMTKRTKIFSYVSDCTRMVAGYWTRVIYDDYDIIKIPRYSRFLNANFTWFVSATQNSHKTYELIFKSDIYDYPKKELLYYGETWYNMSKNKDLLNLYNIHCSKEFIKNKKLFGKPKYFIYNHVNPDAKMMNLINCVGNSMSRDIINLINQDSIGSAAKRAGIVTNSIYDLFAQVLQKTKDKYIKSIRILNQISHILQNGYSDLKKDEDYKFSAEDVKDGEFPEFKNPKVTQVLCGLRTRNEKIKESSEIAIKRVKDNFKLGECHICKNDFPKDEEIIESDMNNMCILPCCQNIICGICAKMGLNFSNHGGKVDGKCFYCRSVIDFEKMIVVPLNKHSASNIIDYKFNYIDEEEEKEQPQSQSQVITEYKETPKMETIIKIIKGIKCENKTQIDMNIDNIVTDEREFSESKEKNILVFAQIPEVLNNIETLFKKHNVNYIKLHGTTKQVFDIQDKYSKTLGNILLVDSTQHCNGLNLQSTTDIVLTHYNKNDSVNTQIIGRGQRLGRTNNLNIHYLVYELEYKDVIDAQNS